MALTAPAPAAPAWSRWPQQYGNNYVVSDGLMPYDSRGVTSAPPQRQEMAPQQYMMTASYSVASVPSIPSPHFPPSTYAFSYQSPAAPQPYRQPHPQSHPQQQYHHAERPSLTILPPGEERDRMHFQRDPRSAYEEHSQSPTVKSEGASSAIAKAPQKVAKTVTSVISINPENEISFDTGVDVLMKAIQAKHETDSIVQKVENKIRAENGMLTPEADSMRGAPELPPIAQLPSPGASQPRTGKKLNRKQYTCDVPNCGRSFGQKTHLDIHKRAHTGDKPYICALTGCGQKFSQLGNLRTHERRHKGIKPYKCSTCDKTFTQRGNVRAHEATHRGLKPYTCKLEGCGKDFSQLGNLKSHQNKFHSEALRELTIKFATIKDSANVTEADKELWEYFAAMYKNLNKGIKGRGKHRKVSVIANPMSPISPMSPNAAISTHLHRHSPISMPQHPSHMHHPGSHASSYHGPSHHQNFAPYNMEGGHHGYLVQPKEEHDVVTPSSASTMYDERPY